MKTRLSSSFKNLCEKVSRAAGNHTRHVYWYADLYAGSSRNSLVFFFSVHLLVSVTLVIAIRHSIERRGC